MLYTYIVGFSGWAHADVEILARLHGWRLHWSRRVRSQVLPQGIGDDTVTLHCAHVQALGVVIGNVLLLCTTGYYIHIYYLYILSLKCVL